MESKQLLSLNVSCGCSLPDCLFDNSTQITSFGFISSELAYQPTFPKPFKLTHEFYSPNLLLRDSKTIL